MQDTVDIDGAFNKLRDAVTGVFEQSAAQMEADIQDAISVPVGYRLGPRGGTYIIRSKRGEAPRKETGTLHSSIAWAVEAALNGVELVVFTRIDYSVYLEDSSLDRPHWSTLYNQWAGILPDLVASRIAAVSH